MSNKNEVFEYLIDQLRQQVNNNQCEDLVHEVKSLKNRLRDMSAQIKELHLGLAQATGDVEAYKLIRKGEHGVEQSGCRKEDTQARESWNECDGYGACPVPDDTVVDIKFRSGEVESNTKALWWSWGTTGGLYDIVAYRVVKQQRRKEDTQECEHEQSGCRKEDVQECEHSWIIMPGLFLSEGNPNNVPGSELCCKCGKREWDVKGYKPKADTQECSHNWRFVNGKAPAVCINCGMTKSSKCEHEWQSYGVGFPCMCIKCGLKK